MGPCRLSLDPLTGVIASIASAALLGCTGGSSGNGGGGCAGSCAQPAGLSSAEVQLIVARGVAEAQANGVAATIAVVDRVGNVLVVVQMPGAPDAIRIDGGLGASTGLDGLDTATVPVLHARAAAISKAGTGAYLSSQGNAFSTRTASHIVQENFNPGERFRAGGPLFGVQFSQLPCGDFVRRLGDPGNPTGGPKRLPLGFSADPGGLPLYKADPNGVGQVPVGGVGVESDGIYALDRGITDFDVSLDERIATAAASGHPAPLERRADRIAVDGRFLRFADDEAMLTPPAAALAIPTAGASPINVAGFYEAAPAYLAGQAFLSAGSGVTPDAVLLFSDEAGNPIPIEVLSSGADPNLYDPKPSVDPAPAAGGMTQNEVTILLREALRVANHARGQIRRPQGSTARVNIAVVDLSGAILGFIRTTDAPMFGADVSVQKARTAAFLSRTNAASILGAQTAAPLDPPFPGRFRAPADYLAALQSQVPGGLSSGIAFSDRAVGNLARPFFPDGINGNGNGPLSRPFAGDWSIFSTGLQLDASVTGIVEALSGVARTACPESTLGPLVANGFQIFPGSVPIYRGNQLVGGIGISGDGVDQDDMVAFLGLHNASLQAGVAIRNAPGAIRADTLNVAGVNLRYVSCPPDPFVDSDAQNVCEGK